MLNRKSIFILSALLTLSSGVMALEPGAPLFQDSFSTQDTFAENWTTGNRNLQFNAGNITMPTGGTITMNRKLPLEFYAEATLVMNKGKNPINLESGFSVMGYRLFMRGDGLGRCVFKLPGEKRSQGRNRRYADFELGKPFKIAVIRKVKSGSANYILRINDRSIANFHTDVPVEDADGSYGKLSIFSRSSVIISNFCLFTLKKSDNDSNNVIFNSGFEYSQEGFPLNYGRSNFDMRQANNIPYEDFINTWTLDTNEKHSGKQSLRVVLDDSVKYQDIWAVGATTFEGKSGVFSVWMKSDKENFPVGLRYGRGFKEVLVGKTWKRYETAVPNLPAQNPMSPVLIRFKKVKGTLWVDDLQAEIINTIDEQDLKSGKTFATPYKPASFDDVFIKEKKVQEKTVMEKKPRGVKEGICFDKTSTLKAGNQLVELANGTPLSLLGRLSFYMKEPEAVFKVASSLPDVDKMTAVLSVAGQTVNKPASSNFKIAIPLDKIANGIYPVTLNLKKDGEIVATASSKLIKRPYKAGATQINHFTRSLIHDGKPIIPMMPFTSAPLRSSDAVESARGYVDWLVKYGFKYAHLLVDDSTVKSGAAFLEYANEKGIKVLLWTKYVSIPDAQGKKSLIRPNGDPNWDAFQKRLDFPCVISQMVLDEPEICGIKSEDAKAFMDQMRARFPYNPTHMNNTIIGIPAGYADLNSDILGIDDYLTNRPERTVESVLKNVDIAVEAGKAEGKPSINFIACHTSPPHYREPTYAEQIAQSYGCIAAGSNGISFYYGDSTTMGNWKALQQLNKEILSLTDVLTSEEECEPATASDSKLRLRTQKHQGHLYVISCNTINNKMEQVNLFLPTNLQYDGDVEVLFEDRKIPLKSNAFTDDFEGYSRHVYKIKIK